MLSLSTNFENDYRYDFPGVIDILFDGFKAYFKIYEKRREPIVSEIDFWSLTFYQ